MFFLINKYKRLLHYSFKRQTGEKLFVSIEEGKSIISHNGVPSVDQRGYISINEMCIVSMVKRMLKQDDRKEDMLHNGVFTSEEFLLVHTASRQAFINLSRIKQAFSKEELLDEIKRLVREQVREQFREKVSA